MRRVKFLSAAIVCTIHALAAVLRNRAIRVDKLSSSYSNSVYTEANIHCIQSSHAVAEAAVAAMAAIAAVTV